jgi:hypothetical protein
MCNHFLSVSFLRQEGEMYVKGAADFRLTIAAIIAQKYQISAQVHSIRRNNLATARLNSGALELLEVLESTEKKESMKNAIAAAEARAKASAAAKNAEAFPFVSSQPLEIDGTCTHDQMHICSCLFFILMHGLPLCRHVGLQSYVFMLDRPGWQQLGPGQGGRGGAGAHVGGG